MNNLTKEIETEILQVYKAGWDHYYRGDLDAYADILSDDYHVVGSSEGENFDSKKEWLDYCRATIDQFAGIIKQENRQFQILPAGDFVMVVERSDAYVKIEDEWRFYSKARITTLLSNEKGCWKFYHQHGSFPDSRAGEGEVIATQQIREENKLLKDAVKRRTIELEFKNRELAIEASLEKLRAVALAMRIPDDLLNVCKVLFKELIELGISQLRNAIIQSYVDEKRFFTDYDYSDFSGGVVSQIPYKGNKTIESFIQRMRESKEELLEIVIEGKELEEWKHFRIANNEDPDSRLDNISALYYYNYSVGAASMGISTFSMITREQLELLKRFRNVFDLAYSRYVDISNAEAQAREVEIELALERIRARTMAMQQSIELPESALLLFQQIQSLGMPAWSAGYCIWDEDKQAITLSMSSEGVLQKPFRLPLNVDPSLIHIREAHERGEMFHVEAVGGDELAAHYQYMRTLPVVGEVLDSIVNAGHQLPTFQIFHCVFFSKGFLLFITYEPVPEAHGIFKRFGNVFEQTYTRFIDLQKAEAQAREAQIELALERVRARTMAMQRSDELGDASTLLDQQVRSLGIETWGCAFNIYNENDSSEWFSSGDSKEFKPYKVPRENIFLTYYEIGRQGAEFHIEEFSGKKCERHYEYLCTIPIMGEGLRKAREAGIPFPVRQIDHVVYFRYGYLLFITLDHVPEAHDIFKRFVKVFEQTYTRFLDLQKAEAQVREATVEAALERIRTRAMVMRTSKDLQQVADTMHLQLSGLGNSELESTLIHLYPDDSDKFDAWYTYKSNHTGKTVKGNASVSKDGSEFSRKVLQLYNSGASTYVIESRGSMLEEWYRQLEVLAPATIDYTEEGELIIPPVLYYNFSRFSGGALLIITECPASREARDLQRRAAKVFDLAFKRFEDLQKAEQQAREAQIEAALERVRSIAMSMMKSEDLPQICQSVFTQLLQLGFNDLRSSQIYLRNDAEEKFINYDYSNELGATRNEIKYNSHPNSRRAFDTANTAGELIVTEIKKEELESWQAYLVNSIGQQPEKALAEADELNYYLYSFGTGVFGISMFRKINEDELQILKRFRNVFSLSYQRYADIAQAEMQAREAKIELSLERVRAKAMAMHNSRDLADTIGVFYTELKLFSITPIRCGVGLLDGEEKIGELYTWNTTEKGESLELLGKLRLEGHPVLEGVYNGWLAQKEFFPVLRGNEIKSYYSVIRPQISFPDYADDVVQYGNFFFFKEGGVYAWTRYEMKEDELQIYRRFTTVLSLTYKRYKDLQQAEANAREAQIEAALEKVRSRTLAMQKSEELAETAAVLFQQLIGLGIEPNRLYISTIKDDIGTSEFWITDEDGSKVSTAYTTNLNDNPTFRKMYEGWKKQLKSLVIDMHGEELEDYFNHLTGLGVPFKGGLFQKRRVQDIAYFSNGFIGIASKEEQPLESLQLLERFAYVFNLTYTRFNDLKIAEAHAQQAELDLIEIKEARKKAEEALTELQLTQGQLIQKEKMASLGELTAGIAHEIQNPLNFVNNFSEVSSELIGEIEDAVLQASACLPDTQGGSNRAEENNPLIVELLSEIKQNLSKINHHGKRADAIVKGMLQHSRQSGGEKVETSLNAFCDEWVRLAYHGFRAKDHLFNVDIQTDFDDNIHRVKIIPQDMGRVILNLLNNAFYAVREKEKQNTEYGMQDKGTGRISADRNYQPGVFVSTKQAGRNVLITVKDNGKGIPKTIVDKIFQPFFTTKPPGQGTGLGLSLSYDIITKGHGGELKVETKENESTSFIIRLPA
ncbi:ATP-binding protein [Pollutibacter soli]|uniref:ATP-binding protein n=1 Tax=Pollutibacter soli TaxID=3034157 RepID=UPI0030135F63